MSEGIPIHSWIFIIVSIVNFALALGNLLYTRKVKSEGLKRQSNLNAFDADISTPIMTALNNVEESTQNLSCLRLKSDLDDAKSDLSEINKAFSEKKTILEDTIERVRGNYDIFCNDGFQDLLDMSDRCLSIINDIHSSNSIDTFTANIRRFKSEANSYCNRIRTEIQTFQAQIINQPSKAFTASSK